MKVSESDKALREHLVWLLRGGNAHMTLDDALEDFPMSQINVHFPNCTYSFWGALDHMRRTQWDILEFMRNPKYKEWDWPKDYWPEKGKLATEADWKKTLRDYKRDTEDLIKIVEDPGADLFAKVPQGTGQTVLREILLVADHNSYEIGEFATMRRVFGHWDINHM